MLYNGTIWVGTADMAPVCLLPQMANRHGLIAGATGTGKTVSLKVLAEGFSDMGVPVFLGDIKGDLSGMVSVGQNANDVSSRLMAVGVSNFQFNSYPTMFWDVYGTQGHPVRATVSEMGPLLLGRMLNLNETQVGVLGILFRVADDEGMLLLDIKDVKAMLAYLGENASNYTLKYGNVSTATVGTIQRAIASLEEQGGDVFFGEPALNLEDWIKTDEDGRGYINILACDKLFLNPLMYSTFMLWMLSELYEILPEQGDGEKPKMVFFFDEAHLLFNNCSKQLMDKIEQVIRLIRSKGVGVYFITQSPMDVPMNVLGQLGNRVQHALRAFTPIDQKAVKVAAQTFRANPAFNTEEAITQLKTGEALLSFLDAHGAPSMVEKALILPPQSQMGTIGPALRQTCIETSPCHGLYEQAVDRESAYEYLAGIVAQGGKPIMPTPLPAVFAAPMAPVPAAPPQPVAAMQPSSAFMVFDPATGQYTQKPLEAMTGSPAPQAVTAPQAVPASQAVQQNVLVLDPTTGQYVQKQVTMQLDPATGQYVPVMSAAEQKATDAAALKAQREAEKAEKERIAEERRQKAELLRDERAERARRNDSVLGRVKNTAINQVTRTVTNELTRSLLGTVTGKRR